MHRRPTAVRHLSITLFAVAGVACGDGKEADSGGAAESGPWADYEIAPPSAELRAVLDEHPFIYPERVCVPAASLSTLPEGATVETNEAGEAVVCVWDLFSGAAPEGVRWNEVTTCDAAFTQGPPWFAAPERVYESPDAVSADPAWAEEASWVQGQIESTGCACCHASSIGSGNTSGFDFTAPAVWTDSMTNPQLAMAAGWFQELDQFGYVEPSENHGFDRRSTLFPTTDPARMQAFFADEFDRRGGTDGDKDDAAARFDALFGSLSTEPAACVEPYEGLIGGLITWNGEDTARQVYVLELGADTPAFPPNLDLPAGTLWALYVDNEGAPIESGTLSVGDLPVGAEQRIPADGSAPALVVGETYRLVTKVDIMLSRPMDCTFTWTGP